MLNINEEIFNFLLEHLELTCEDNTFSSGYARYSNGKKITLKLRNPINDQVVELGSFNIEVPEGNG